VTTDMSYCP